MIGSRINRMTGGRKAASRTVAGVVLAIGAVALLTVGLPKTLPLIAGGSAALEQLAARSPGARVGGVALKGKLKGKTPLAALAPSGGPSAEKSTPAGPGTPENPVALVLGSTPGPAETPLAPGGFPGEFVGPGGPGASPPIDFGPSPFPPIGGVPIIVPGGPGGPVDPGVPPPVDPPIPAIPEPSTWLMLIAGFGVIGSAMRRRQLRGAIA